MSDILDNPSISADAVQAYLEQHPDFFVGRDALLERITVPHDSGKAVSLVERQVNILRERNVDMRHRLNKLLSSAKDNDQLFEKTKRLILSMLDAKNLDELNIAVEESFTQDFQINMSKLIVLDEPTNYLRDNTKVVALSDAQQKVGNIINGNKAVCGVLKPDELEFLFGGRANEVGSAAVTPLLNGKVIGILALGSFDDKYFRSSMGTLFLSYVGEVLARALPRFMIQNKTKASSLTGI